MPEINDDEPDDLEPPGKPDAGTELDDTDPEGADDTTPDRWDADGEFDGDEGESDVSDGGQTPEQLSPEALQIAHGHAWDKHSLEYPEYDNANEFASHVDSVMNNPTENKDLPNNRSAYWGGDSGTVVITNPADPDGGTAFRPKNGKNYYDGLQ